MLHLFNIRTIAIMLYITTLYGIAKAQTWTSLNGPWRVNDGRDITVGYSGGTRVLYAADYEYRLVKSTNDGSNWSRTGNSQENEISFPVAVSCEPNDPTKLVVAIFDGTAGIVKRSTNSGDGWENIPINESNLQPYRFGRSPANSQNVFLGTKWKTVGSASTLRKSTNGGANFRNDFYFFGTVQTHLLAIAWHPTDQNKVWAGGSSVEVKKATEAPPEADDTYQLEGMQAPQALQKGIWYSTNAGNNWSAVSLWSGSNKNVSALAVTVSGGTTTLWAGTAEKSTSGCQLYKSTDNGSTWTQVLSYYIGSMTQIVVNTANNRIYVSNNRLGVSVSFDGGTTWYHGHSNKNLADFDARAVAVHPNDANTAFVMTSSCVFKGTLSSPGTIPWSQINTGLNIVEVSSAASTGGAVFAVANNFPVVARYTDSWNMYYARGDDDYEAFSGQSVFINPFSSSKVVAVGTLPREEKAVIFRSSTNGVIWGEVYRSTSSDDEYNLYGTVADPKVASGRFYAFGKTKGDNVSSSKTNYLVSDNEGNNWIVQPAIHSTTNPPPVFSMAIDPSGAGNLSNIFYAGLQSYGVYRTSNAGADWFAWSIGNTTIYSVALNPNIPSTVYAGGNVLGGYGMWKSTNSGTSWSAVTNRTDVVKKILMHPTYPGSKDRLFIIGGNGTKVYETANGGASWTDITGNLPTPINDLQGALDGGAIIASTAGGVYKIDPAPETPTGVNGTTSGNHPKIYWNRNKEADLQPQPYKVYRYYVDCPWYLNKWVCGGRYGETLLTTTSDTFFIDYAHAVLPGNCEPGQTLKKAFYYVVAVDKGNNQSSQSSAVGFSIGCSGGEDPTKTVIRFDDETNTTPLPEFFMLESNYPNPFNPLTTIKYTLPEDARVVLKIYNTLGEEVKILVNEYQTAGFKQISFDASNLPSGVYFYKLTAGKFTQVRKMLLAKQTVEEVIVR